MRILVLLFLAAGALVACSKGPQRPDIILISVDTLRWDYLNPYGFQEPEFTPAINRLAAAGTVFENAVTTAGTTVPAHGSMLTGVYPRQHGARSNFHNKYPDVPTVAEALHDAGYQTGAFVSAGFLIKRGLGAGFEVNNTTWKGTIGSGATDNGARTVEQARDWLDSIDRKQPYFLWLHLFDPHGPYEPSDWSRAQLTDYHGFLKDGVSVEDSREHRQEIISSPDDLHALRMHYAGEVHRADSHIGVLLDYLRDRGTLNNTVIVFTADHGQALGAGGLLGHGATHIEAVIHVPIIVADFRHPQARRSSTRISVVDITPTIADAARVHLDFPHAGRSLLDPDSLAEDWPYFVEVALRTPKNQNWKHIQRSGTYDPNAVAVYVGMLKMTYKQGQYRLFETGPHLTEAREIDVAKEPVMADYLHGLIDTFHENKLDLSSDELSGEDLETLKGLGYVQ